VAIAPDGSGDQLVLDPTDGWRVLWWRHDEHSTCVVASSFSELLDKLRADPHA
jgi:hypothetical protein